MKVRKFSLATFILILPSSLWGESIIIDKVVRENKEYQLACEFIEHYAQLLQSANTVDSSDSIRRIKDDGFTYRIGNDKELLELKGDEDFSISFSDYAYSVKWSNNGITVVECAFPANIGLLKLTNKINLENRMIECLENMSTQEICINLPISKKNDLTRISLSDYFVADKGFYITPRLKNQIIFEPIPDDTVNCRMMVDYNKYKLESLANMMLSGYSIYPQNICVKVSKYDYTNTDIQIPLTSLFQLLSDEGCEPYWGVDTFDGNEVKGVYVWVNQFGGYAHLLSVNIPINAVYTPTDSRARLHCYLRLDNLKSLFEEYDSL